jgi:hypothetical protein
MAKGDQQRPGPLSQLLPASGLAGSPIFSKGPDEPMFLGFGQPLFVPGLSDQR